MSFDWTQYKGNLAWLPERTIYLTVSGSYSYGTAIPGISDVDTRGIAIPPKEYYLGFNQRFEQAECKDPDLTIFELKKFIELATNANPNVLELLYTDPKDHLVVSPLGKKLIDNRELFLSQRAKYTFSGYAVSQLNRLKSHRRWLLNPPKAPPTREEFGLPNRTVIPSDQLEAANAAIKKRLDDWNWKCLDGVDSATSQAVREEFSNKLCEITNWTLDGIDHNTWLSAANSIGLDTNFIRLLDLEKSYSAKLNEWRNYLEWKENRNKVRGEMEAKFGYDGKHGLHLIRLLTMANEIIGLGKVIVKRPDAEFLLSIRNGSLTYDQLVEYTDNKQKELEELMKTTKLPKTPNRKAIDRLCVELVEEGLYGKNHT